MKLFDIRRDYTGERLTLTNTPNNPFEQFKAWLQAATDSEGTDPTAMTLSTVDAEGLPDSRIVLLKELDSSGFCFFTNYDSDKGQQLAQNPKACLNFYWAKLTRQVTIRGTIAKLNADESDRYFKSRPFASQVAALASPQSQTIEQTALYQDYQSLFAQYENKPITLQRPPHWGGYRLTPIEVEFWQGQANRLHDRIRYHLETDQTEWIKMALAP